MQDPTAPGPSQTALPLAPGRKTATPPAALAGEFNPEVVLLDLDLPDIDGYEVLRRLQQLSGKKPAVVALIASLRR